MASVVWRREALDDLDQITLYIQQFDPAAAIRVRSRISDLGDSLIHFPRRGRPVDDGTRELTTAPPYIIAYDISGEEVTILSVRHGARNKD
ncbi:MAG: type II toxin-antitoxin system RelE/ParE family toxin [Sphingomonas taxi]